MGTPRFAVPSLRALVSAGHDVVAVVTQPDKPKGRGRRTAPPPVKCEAVSHGIQVLQPAKIRTDEFALCLEGLEPEVVCVVAYGKILPKRVLDIPPRGCINVHASLLPKYRGAAPVNWAIIRGERTTGVTTMLMDEGMDTGDILLQRQVAIEDDDAETLAERLSHVGAELLVETLEALERGALTPRPQDDSAATYAPMLKKEMGLIDWSRDAEEIRNLVRGLRPWPGAYTQWGEKTLKVIRAVVAQGEGRPGEVIEASTSLVVAAGRGALRIEELQLEGSKRMGAADFLRGHRIETGTVLGSGGEGSRKG